MSTTSDSFLEDLQSEIAGRIRADVELGALPLVTERAGDVLAEIERALGLVTSDSGNTGLCIVVLQVTADAESEELPGPVLDASIAVRVLENPMTNNVTGSTALTVARRITRLLHQYTPGGIAGPLLPERPLIDAVTDPVAQVAYEVRFRARESTALRRTKVSTPSLSLSSASAPATLTVACTTSGASIWVTQDGAFPGPHTPGAQIVETTLPIAAACTVRAAAYAADLFSSDTASITLA